MKNIYTCGCLANDFHNKTLDEVLQIFERPSDYSIFVRINFENDFYICCRKIIEFCFKVHRWYFLNKTCSSRMSGLHVSCYHLLKFGFNTICQECIYPLEIKLFPFLFKVK